MVGADPISAGPSGSTRLGVRRIVGVPTAGGVTYAIDDRRANAHGLLRTVGFGGVSGCGRVAAIFLACSSFSPSSPRSSKLSADSNRGHTTSCSKLICSRAALTNYCSAS
jgi:hypothetical protein